MATRTRTRLGIDERRAQLLEVGLELFSTRPYDEVRIDEVAARAGVSRGLLYHYFPTKRDFYVDVVRASIADAYEFSEPDPSLPPLGRLRASVDAWLDYVESNAAGFLTAYGAGIGTDPEVRRSSRRARSAKPHASSSRSPEAPTYPRSSRWPYAVGSPSPSRPWQTGSSSEGSSASSYATSWSTPSSA